MDRKKLILLAVVSGLLIGLSYIPFFPILGLVALVPLWVALDQVSSFRQALKLSWISQFIFSLIGFYWVAFTAHEFGFMPWWLSIIVLLLFSSVIHLHFLISAGFYFWCRKRFSMSRTEGDILKLCSLYLAETYWPMLFPWNFGYSWMSSALPLKQTAEIWGFTGISFFVLLANFAVKQVFDYSRDARPQKAKKTAFSLIFVFACFNLSGLWLKSSVPSYNEKWDVAVIQANIGNLEKVKAETDRNYQIEILDRYTNLTKEMLAVSDKKPDLIVWPETAIPFVLSDWNKNNPLYRRLQKNVREFGVALISGSFLLDERPYNAAVLVSEEGKILDRYKKNLLLAWGETVPFTDPYPEFQDSLKKILPALSFFGPGEGPRITKHKSLRVGINICYEAIHPVFMNSVKNQAVNIMLNLTNDSWFGDTSEPIQHMYMTLARSIELRVPMIRSTNTGISTVSLADGSILEKSPINKKWFGRYEIPGHSIAPITLYQRMSGYTPWTLVLITGLVTLHRRKKGAKKSL